MSTKKPGLSLQDHFDLADSLAIAEHHLVKMFFLCQEKQGKSKKLCSMLRPIAIGLTCIIGKLQCELDRQYHELITDEEFAQYGHIYYNLNKRYEKLEQKRNVAQIMPKEP